MLARGVCIALIVLEMLFLATATVSQRDFWAEAAFSPTALFVPALLAAVVIGRAGYEAGILFGLASIVLLLGLPALVARGTEKMVSGLALSVWLFGPGVIATLAVWLVRSSPSASLCMFTLAAFVAVLTALALVSPPGAQIPTTLSQFVLCMLALFATIAFRITRWIRGLLRQKNRHSLGYPAT